MPYSETWRWAWENYLSCALGWMCWGNCAFCRRRIGGIALTGCCMEVKARMFSRSPELNSSKLGCGKSWSHFSSGKWHKTFSSQQHEMIRHLRVFSSGHVDDFFLTILWTSVSAVWVWMAAVLCTSSWLGCLFYYVGDHGYVEDLCFPRCLCPDHMPDVLLTSRTCQVRHSTFALHSSTWITSSRITSN